jgi:hypothetical protein
MKKLILIVCLLSAIGTNAQVTGSITVGGDFDKFYPTVWLDGGWGSNVRSELEIVRSGTHMNSDWRGALVAKFEYHTNAWGNGANFIDADITQTGNKMGSDISFIAGWDDVSTSNGSNEIVIWLRGGGTTYYFKSINNNYCRIYDGVAYLLPFQVVNGPAITYKTQVDSYVNSNGISKNGAAYFRGNNVNYFAGNVGIGTSDTKGYKLAIAGGMIAESVKVKLQGVWPDYVFNENYKIEPLDQLEKQIKETGHLPHIPSAEKVKTHGIDLEEMNILLLKKIEELTLIVIEQNKRIVNLEKASTQIRQL